MFGYLYIKSCFHCLCFLFFCFIVHPGVFLSGQALAGQDKLQVIVSIAPQKYFLERIGGDLVQTTVLLPAGASPHTFEPRPSQVRELGSADIYMTIGVEYEKALLHRIESLHSDLEIAPVDHGIEKIAMTKSCAHDHNHGHNHGQDRRHNHGHNQDHKHHHHHEHEYNGLDPHVWLAPDTAMLIAENIFQSLAGARPDKENYFRDNYLEFIEELKSLDQEIKTIFRDVAPESRFMVFHPAWGYFARAYGLVQVPVEVEGREPKPADLKELIDTAVAEDIRIVFVSPQFSKRSAETIAKAINGQTAVIDPLAEEWDKNLIAVAQKIAQAAGSSQ